MSKQPQIEIKLLINKEKNQVVLAESDGNFVDVLLSFLTLPMGTVIRLLESDSTIGSISNLYKSVTNLSKKHLRTEECLKMVTRPRNAYHNYLRPCNLEITIDSSEQYLERTKFYTCRGNCKNDWVSTVVEKCPCGDYFYNERDLDGRDGGYVNRVLKYIITDGLQVMPVFTSSAAFALLKEYGVEESTMLTEQILHLGAAEVLLLLKQALLSKGPLTDVLLNNSEATISSLLEPRTPLETHNTAEQPNSTKKLSLKLMVCKSSNKILYAEAGADFIDFVFSFLTFPLGAVTKLLGENSSMGCIDNLYKSVKDIPFDDDKLSERCKKMFLDPKLPQHVKCSSQLLNIDEEGPFQLVLCKCGSYEKSILITDISFHCECQGTPKVLNAINRKLQSLGTTSGGGFMNDNIMCMVTDSLEVKPLSPFNVISMLNVQNVQVHNIEEQVVLVGEKEGLKLLKAALTSNTVLNDVFG